MVFYNNISGHTRGKSSIMVLMRLISYYSYWSFYSICHWKKWLHNSQDNQYFNSGFQKLKFGWHSTSIKKVLILIDIRVSSGSFSIQWSSFINPLWFSSTNSLHNYSDGLQATQKFSRKFFWYPHLAFIYFCKTPKIRIFIFF